MSQERLKLQYKDYFWSSDYITGINALIQTMEKGQLEGKICFNYLQNQSSILELETTKMIQFFNTQEKLLNVNNTIKSDNTDVILKELGFSSVDSFKSLQELSFEQFEALKDISNQKQQLLSEIQSDILMRLGDFMEDYKYFTDDLKSDLLSQYSTYKKSLQAVESAKSKFYTKSRQLDDYTKPSTETKESKPVSEVQEVREKSLPEIPSPEIDTSNEIKESEDDSDDNGFQFPLIIGSTTFADEVLLRKYINSAFSEIPVKRRVIPLPGMNNEYFTSENLSIWIKRNFPNEDTRRKVEKFGQNLITLGLICNWNKLGQNIYVSDGGYYEYTDLARYVAKFDENQNGIEQETQTPVKRQISANTTPQKQASSASEVWSGLKNRWGTSGNLDSLKEQCLTTRNQYYEAVKVATVNKENLEISYNSYLRKAQNFDTTKVKLIHELQSNLHNNLIAGHLSEIKSLEIQVNNLALSDESIDIELLQPTLSLPIGWYWSKSEANFIDNINPSPNIAIFGVDLIGQYVDTSTPDFKHKSVPLFILQSINQLNDIDYDIDFWVEELDIVSASKLKQWSLSKISEVSENDAKERIYQLLDEIFETFTTKEIINFLKLWLLEIPDSLLPFTIYDALVLQYDKKEDKSTILQTISTISRQNLSTLLHVMSHLSSKFANSAEILTKRTFKVPFIHLILRPAPKKTHFNIQDAFILSNLVSDLLDYDFQELLYCKLNEMEEYHQEKQKKAEDSINRLKDFRNDLLKPVPVLKGNVSQNHNLTSEGLKLFKTKSPLPSPGPSPGTSPIGSPKSKPAKPAKTHARGSSLLSAPAVRRPSESLSKRHSQVG